jgi:hypothetical protein
MCKLSLVFLTLSLLAYPSLAEKPLAEKRTIACKTPILASACVTIHGRLQYGNGTPALRLWHIGTTHKFGIYSGLNAEKRDPLDNEHPQLPANLTKVFDVPDTFGPTIFADFEVCPLEPKIAGHMQAACIESANHITVEK